MRPSRTVARAALIAALALGSLPGLVGSRQPSPEQPIDASFHRIDAPKDSQSGDALEIVLEDSGVTANPEKMCGRALEDIRPGGLGLHFIRECMDTVEFSRNNGRNQLRLVKFLHVQAPKKGA